MDTINIKIEIMKQDKNFLDSVDKSFHRVANKVLEEYLPRHNFLDIANMRIDTIENLYEDIRLALEKRRLYLDNILDVFKENYDLDISFINPT